MSALQTATAGVPAWTAAHPIPVAWPTVARPLDRFSDQCLDVG
jgi:hypothetical protein